MKKKTTAANSVVWFDMGAMPFNFGFTMSEKAFNEKMKLMKVDEPPSFLINNSAGTTHHFSGLRGMDTALVCIDYNKVKRHEREIIYGLMVHESVHVLDYLLESMNDKNPSAEFKAYTVQGVAQFLFYQYRLALLK